MQTTAAIYDYSANQTTPFEVTRKTALFLVIVANTTQPAGYPYWAWMSDGCIGPPYSNDSGGPVSDLSRTFTLADSAVPEPSYVVLLALGVAGICSLRKRAFRLKYEDLFIFRSYMSGANSNPGQGDGPANPR
jgi:hypothetical protein